MINLSNVLILKWGKTNSGYEFKKQQIEFPKETIVNVYFDERKVVGKANKFRIMDDGIICNIVLDKKITDTIAPSLKFYDSVKFKLSVLSLVNNHLCEDLNGNLGVKAK